MFLLTAIFLWATFHRVSQIGKSSSEDTSGQLLQDKLFGILVPL